MYLKPKKRRCLRWGHIFTYMQGDLIFELFPKCPKCGSHLTCKAPLI